MSASPTPPLDQLEALGLEVVRQGSPAYEGAREEITWNKRLQRARAPAAIIRPKSAEQVAAAIRLAVAHGIRVALRGSGHSYIAAFLRDGGWLLDLGGLDSLVLDEEKRTARAGPGVRGGDLLEALARRGLAFPVGHCADVALGGYLLSGGIGWNYGEWGPASHSVIGVEMVTAAGEIVHASAEQNQDLFWAARGAGAGFFAAVTAYELALHLQPPAAWLWTAAFASEGTPVIADWLTAAAHAADPSAEIMCLVGPDVHSGRPSLTIRAIGTGQTPEEARSRVASFRSPPTGAELLSDISEKAMAFAELPKLSAMPRGKRVAADQVWTDASLGEMALAVYHLAGLPHAPSSINLVVPGGGGAIPHMPDGKESAFSLGGGPGAGIYAMWDEAEDDRLHLDWVREADAALAPFKVGRYIGEADLGAGPGRPAECFTPEAFARLSALRSRYDPDSRFFGFPVPPAESSD